ncbi:MAG: hypothetical protein WD556_02605 [Actinomycetota bacterium]
MASDQIRVRLDRGSFLYVAPSGWARYTSPQLNVGVFVRLAALSRETIEVIEPSPIEAESGLRIVEMVVNAPWGIHGRQLRDVPVGRIEGRLNAPGTREQLLDLIQGGGDARGPRPAEQVAELVPLETEFEDAREVASRKLVLKPPESSRYPDSFYFKVARAFQLRAGVSARPVQDIAEASDVPVSTLNRWIREARARGLLLPTGARESAMEDARAAQTLTRGLDRLITEDEVREMSRKLWGRSLRDTLAATAPISFSSTDPSETKELQRDSLHAPRRRLHAELKAAFESGGVDPWSKEGE